MYQKYHTDALVIACRDVAETDRAIALYTRDFGLVWARAAAVRTEKSKMRYSLSNFTRAQVSLVRGKRGWRLAGTTPETTAIGKEAAGVRAFARVCALVLRLVTGEEENAYLFEVLAEAQSALLQCGPEMAPVIELVCVARMLYTLGYLSSEALGTALFTHTAFATEVLAHADSERDSILGSINRALSETHL
jgi:recombinational DNA repair protein (RecF pathway)